MFSTSQEEAPSRLVKPDALNALYSFNIPLLQIPQFLTHKHNTDIFHTPLSIDNNYSIMSVHSSSILLLLLLCLLSMHACSSRPLSNKHSAGKLHSIKVGKVKRMLYSTTFDPSKDKDVKVTIKHHEGSDASTTDQETNKQNTSSKDLKFSTNTQVAEAKKKMSNPASGVAQRDQSLVSVSFRVPRKKQQGSEVIMSYDVGLRHSNIEGSEMKAQSVVGSDPHSTEETINSKENGDHDVVAMDYEPPHRRPPIHNLSP